jgi:hypothetical protein
MSKAFACLGAGAVAALVLVSAQPLGAQGAGYERPPSFAPTQILPPDLVHSPYHSIVGPVTVDGFLDLYQLQTKYGTFPVLGTDLLRMRVHEVAATAQIEQIGGAETLATSVGKTALKPLGTAKDLVTAPGKTVSDTFKGVGNIFGQVKAGVSATDPHREGTIASLTGGSKARRKLAYDFGVDPYTTFDPLGAELKRVATSSAIGETATNAGLAFVTGGAGIAISVGGTSSDLRLALRDKSAADLEALGHQELAAMGISEGAIAAFYANQWLTPTDKATIVDAMMHLGTAGGREIFIARTAQATTYAEGFAYRRKAELTASYQRRVAPIRSFVNVAGTPLMQTATGAVAIVPMDYLYWSPQLEGLIGHAGPHGEIWITGTASQLATQNLASRGWTVVPKASARLEH